MEQRELIGTNEEGEAKSLTPFDLERMAYAGAKIPDGLGYADTLYYLCLRNLHDYARRNGWTPEQGKAEKLKIINACKKYRLDQEAAKIRAMQMLMTGAAITEYRKAVNEEERLRAADRIVESLDRVPVNHLYH